MNTKYHNSHRGFTLVEMMIVVVIIGIIAAAAAPEFDRAIERIEFKSKTKSALSMLRTARSSSISEKQPYGVFFDYDNSSYTFFRDDYDPMNFAFDEGLDSVIRVDTMTGQWKYVWASFVNSAVVFRPNGTASETGWIYMGSYTDETINHSGINVLASTGNARIMYLENY